MDINVLSNAIGHFTISCKIT